MLVCLVLLLALCPVLTGATQRNLSIEEFGDTGLNVFLQAAADKVPVEMLVGIWLYEGRDISQPEPYYLGYLADVLYTRTGQSERNQLKAYNEGSTARTQIQAQIARMSDVLCVLNGKRFPLADGITMWYEDTWNAPRVYGGDRPHEGVDIICAQGTPVYAVCDGVVEKRGWNTLGGWRVGVRGTDGVYYYYAHFEGYASGIRTGATVKKGQILGYVGSTGYGPVGTSDQMIPHLHFGMYLGYGESMYAVNSYPFLAQWQTK